MGLERIVYIEKDLTLDDSGVKTIDINVNEPISFLEFLWKNTNGATNNQANHLHDLVSKIELVDGSDVLYSLPMVQMQALNFFEMGKTPLMNLTEWANDGAREAAYMNFGRHPYDRELAFVPSRFANPQIKVTWDFTGTTACGATGYVSGSGSLTILAHIVPGVAASRGFLMAKELYSFTSAASGDERIDLPQDYPYRLLTVRSLEDGNDFRENISNLKLSLDQDRLILFDIEAFRLQELNRDMFGKHSVGTKLDRAHGDTVIIHTDELDTLQLMSDQSPNVPYASWGWSSNFLLGLYNVGTGAAHTSDDEIRCFEEGYTFHDTVAWNFGDMKEINEWFDPTAYRSIRAILSQAQSGAAVSVCLQQLRR